jgi:hypothetical protein
MKILFVPQNHYDGIPFASKPYEMDITDITNVNNLFNAPTEEKLSTYIKGYTHMIYEGEACSSHYNDAMCKLLKRYIPKHWTFDEGGILGNAVLFVKD